MLTEKDVEEFRQIYQTEFKEYISPEKAKEIASQLLELYSQIYRKLPEEEK